MRNSSSELYHAESEDEAEDEAEDESEDEPEDEPEDEFEDESEDESEDEATLPLSLLRTGCSPCFLSAFNERSILSYMPLAALGFAHTSTFSRFR